MWLAIRISGSIGYRELDVWVEYKINTTGRHSTSRNNKTVYSVNLLLPTEDTWIPSVSFPEGKGEFSTCPALQVLLPKILLRWRSGAELTTVDPVGHFGQLLVLPHKYKSLWLMPQGWCSFNMVMPTGRLPAVSHSDRTAKVKNKGDKR